MATVKIGHARYDENGNISGGRSGDQTGRELMISDWYPHKLGWVVLRCNDRVKALKIAQADRAACDNNCIGYDQSQRNTLYNAAKGLGFDPAKVTTPVETDCSALVRVCCEFAGIPVPDFNTSTEANTLMATELFTKLTDSKYTTKPDYLLTGDILCTATKGHTGVVLNDGELAGGGTAGAAVPAGAQTATVTCQSLNVRVGPGTEYSAVATVHNGDRLELTGKAQGKWREVKYRDGKIGWCSDVYLKIGG